MNKFIFMKKPPFQYCANLAISLLISSICLAQTPDNSPLDKSELDAINQQPIAKTTGSKEQIQGKDQRKLSFELKEENGTHVREYRENSKPVEIDVESSMGTHYQMSTPSEQTPTIPDKSINRVPSIRMPF